VYDRLRGKNAALCIADTEKGHAPLVATADWGYLRLRDEGYTPAGLAEWATTIQTVGAGWRETYIYFKHEESGVGPAFARQMRELLPGP
jgi:uncharacterized protein YecE (DUF72 family)